MPRSHSYIHVYTCVMTRQPYVSIHLWPCTNTCIYVYMYVRNGIITIHVIKKDYDSCSGMSSWGFCDVDKVYDLCYDCVCVLVSFVWCYDSCYDSCYQKRLRFWLRARVRRLRHVHKHFDSCHDSCSRAVMILLVLWFVLWFVLSC